MSIALNDPVVARAHAALGAYARRLLDRCADNALQWHADEVGPEHLLAALMEDEDCAAHRLAVHAFADPETIAEEARAMAAGILISGSSRALPFSASGVRALRAARASAAERRDGAVEIAHVLLATERELEPDLRAAFEDAGWNPRALEDLLGPAGTGSVAQTGHLFHHFSDSAKRLLSASAKLARSAEARAISAAHLLLAGLQTETRFERAAGLPASRARLVLRQRTEDTSRVGGGPLPADTALEAYLATLSAGTDSLGMLAAFHGAGTRELAQVLTRNRITAALIERSRSAFSDPDE